MSGGSYDYAFSHVSDMADAMRKHQTPLRIAFRGLLERVSVAMKAVEWVDSGDCSEPHAEDAIRACFDYHPDLDPLPKTHDCDCYKKVDTGHTLQCRSPR